MSTSIEASFHALIVLTVAFMAGFPSIGLGGAFVMWIVYKVAADWLDDWCSGCETRRGAHAPLSHFPSTTKNDMTSL
ncbi:hypothetical protein [Shinella zoogloeoides]|uniref:hypothetical protein n=1 Tax=Shinella zoogloeoides TaxID=352475 RepID=UPI00299D0EAC|nr:hypothetical protein [Shinella zoogloeoides]